MNKDNSRISLLKFSIFIAIVYILGILSTSKNFTLSLTIGIILVIIVFFYNEIVKYIYSPYFFKLKEDPNEIIHITN